MELLELMVELPVITLLGFVFVCTFPPLRSRVSFMKPRSNRSVNILRVVLALTIGGGVASICWVYQQYVPLIVAQFIALPIGLAVGCGVVFLLRRYCRALLRSVRVERGIFVVFAGLCLFIGALIGISAEDSRDWIIAAGFAGFAAFEWVMAFFWPMRQPE